ncbi:hypothetical protein E4U53_005170 [Claviceps sorghi]|nr:hypothetical protein E4U53_005170 [Claviceps sorghi]
MSVIRFSNAETAMSDEIVFPATRTSAVTMDAFTGKSGHPATELHESLFVVGGRGRDPYAISHGGDWAGKEGVAGAGEQMMGR